MKVFIPVDLHRRTIARHRRFNRIEKEIQIAFTRDTRIRQRSCRGPPENPSLSNSPAYDDRRTRVAIKRELADNRGLPRRARLQNYFWRSGGVIARQIRRESLPFEFGYVGVNFCFRKEG